MTEKYYTTILKVNPVLSLYEEIYQNLENKITTMSLLHVIIVSAGLMMIVETCKSNKAKCLFNDGHTEWIGNNRKVDINIGDTVIVLGYGNYFHDGVTVQGRSSAIVGKYSIELMNLLRKHNDSLVMAIGFRTAIIINK